ncbi:MAG: peptide deformylase [Hungatella sp.]|nr:peptide deformylase [Hungatella sp.]
MAIRKIRTIGDEILYKNCKPVKMMTPRMAQIIEDMFDTMYESNGVGLAGPQVGILKQVVVIDVEDGNQYVLINPEIIEEEGNQTGHEACLSVPGKTGIVTRPERVKVKALNEKMEEYILEGEGMLARAICHECDHLKGQLFVSVVEGELKDVSEVEEEEEED